MTDEPTIHDVVVRLSRPRPGGGHVIERAAMLAEGAQFHQVEAWVLSHGGHGEVAPSRPIRGLFAQRDTHQGAGSPVRYVLPLGALD